MEKIVAFPVIAASVQIVEGEEVFIVYRTGCSNKLALFCLCGSHFPEHITVTSPLLRVWNDNARQLALIQSIIHPCPVIPLDKKRHRILSLHTNSLTKIPPKFMISPLIFVCALTCMVTNLI